MMMREDLLNQLAIAYAQAKLMKDQAKGDYNLDGYDEEIEGFLKSYLFAIERMPDLWPTIGD